MTSPKTVRQRNRIKRVIGWVFFYLCAFAGFTAVIYLQGSKVNTLELPTGQITLTTDKTKYTVGNTIHFTLANGLNTTIFLQDTCPHELLHVYQWKNNAWAPIHATAATSACTTQKKSIPIAPHKTVTESYAPWKSLFNKPGIFRLVAFAENYNGLAYADFQVVAPPAPPAPPKVIYKPVYTPVYTPIYISTPSSGGDGGGGGGGDN